MSVPRPCGRKLQPNEKIRPVITENLFLNISLINVVLKWWFFAEKDCEMVSRNQADDYLETSTLQTTRILLIFNYIELLQYNYKIFNIHELQCIISKLNRGVNFIQSLNSSEVAKCQCQKCKIYWERFGELVLRCKDFSSITWFLDLTVTVYSPFLATTDIQSLRDDGPFVKPSRSRPCPVAIG